MQRRWLGALAALALAGPISGCGYNTIQTLDEQANKAKSGIEVQLQRRADLVPNLVNTVKGYAQHEEAVFTQVAQARAGLAGAVQTHDVAKMAEANQVLSQGLGRLLAISEAYPQLKADQGFLRLHSLSPSSPRPPGCWRTRAPGCASCDASSPCASCP